jgi:hypothetical protein
MTAPTPGQLSVALPVPNVVSRFAIVTPQEDAPGPVKSVTAGGAVTTGGVLSVTVTTCVSVAVLPERSVAVYVTVVLPTGKIFAAGTPVRVTVTPAQLSFATADPSCASVTSVPQLVAPGPVLTLTSAGAVMVGGIAGLSVTVTSCCPAVVFPAESVAV